MKTIIELWHDSVRTVPNTNLSFNQWLDQWSLMKNQTSLGILSFLAYFHNSNKSLKRFVP
jgi:hypothetical protein